MSHLWAASTSGIGETGRLRRRQALVLSIGAAAFVLTLVSAAEAVAAPKPVNGFVGGSAGINTGGLFTQPRDVAVYTADTPASGDDKVFVVESLGNNSRVHRLDGDGNFELLWGKDVIRAGVPGNTGQGYEICEAAVSGAAGCKSAPVGSGAGEFDEPTGVDVSQLTGHVYVMDRDNRRVQEFDLDGEFVRAWGWNVAPDGQDGDTPSDQFEICTDVCQAGVAGSGAGQFQDASHNTVVVSPLAPNDVFVTDSSNQRILQFEAEGQFVRGWGFDVAGGGAFETCDTGGCQPGQGPGDPSPDPDDGGKFAAGEPRHVAIDQSGVVYASDTTANNRVVRFDADPAPPGNLLAPLPSPGILSSGTTVGLEVDSNTADLLAAREPGSGPAVVNEIADPAADLPPGGPPNPTLADTHVFSDEGPVRGLGYSTATESIYLSAVGLFTAPVGNFTGCTTAIESFDCQGLIVLAVTSGPLTASLEAPSDVSADTASLVGSVGPGGGVARYQFQISADGANWTDAAEPAYASGSSDVDVSVLAAGLQPATLYRVRLSVTKQTGISTTESVVSNEDVFLTDATPPAASTLGVSRRTDTGVRLRGLVDPQGSPTTHRFEYGPAGGSFDHHFPIPDAEAGSGNSSQMVVQDVAGLQPETAYHYRIVATNAVGTTQGDAITFKTKAPIDAKPSPGRAYELVSTGDKIAGVGTGVWFNGPAAAGLAGHAAYEGERFAVQGSQGAVLVDGKYAFANDWGLSERTPTGWVVKPLMSRRAFGAHPIVFIQMHSATPSMSLMSWGGSTVKLFAEMEDWPKEVAGATLYLRDWNQDRWEVFGPTDIVQGGGAGLTTSGAIAADGRSAIAGGRMRGLAGPSDPTLDQSPGVLSVYLDELPNGPSDSFPGDGVRTPVNTCDANTRVPRRLASGKLSEQSCIDQLVDTGGASLTDSSERAISSDGSRVFFMAPDHVFGPGECLGSEATTACPAQLYVRQRNNDNSVITRWISKSEVTQVNGASADQDASLMDEAIFQGASIDGDKVFFTTTSPLTADDPNGEGQAPPAGGIVTGTPSQDSGDLYMYDLLDTPDADPAGGDLTRISAGPTGESECDAPTGALRFVSEDGSRLYFTCSNALDGVPVTSSGTSTSPGSGDNAVNLYAFDTGRPQLERWQFIARMPITPPLGQCATTATRLGMPLGPNNDADASINFFNSDPPNCMRGTLDGSLIAFWTGGQLTDDDPDAVSGDIYAYDAIEEELVRVSAPQGGVGGSYLCAPGTSSVTCYGDGGIGASNGDVPLPALGVAQDPEKGERMVFFQSKSRLVPADTDANYDVYQWKGGTLTLITLGTLQDAFFKGNDRAGTNIYLASRDQLSWQDKDVVLDVYSARVGDGIPEPLAPEPCDAVLGQCQGLGQALEPGQTDSDDQSGGNPSLTKRIVLGLTAPSAKVRRKAARTGKLPVRVTTTAPALVRLIAKARLAGKNRQVASMSQQSDRAVKLTLKLNRAARKRLKAGRALRVALTATALASRAVTTSFRLKR
jgi:hypothetical protein